jgi:hypothetical protein
MFDPQGAVVVEHGDAVGRGHVVAAAGTRDAGDEVQIFRLGEVSDQLGSGTLVMVASERLRRGI